MTKLSTFLALAAVHCACLLGATPVYALAGTTFVSGKGTDSGDCASPARPCRSFSYALNQTLAGGEIKTLDAANYFSVTINKSISLTGVEGAGITRSARGAAILVNAGTGKVWISRLILDGSSAAGSNGIEVISVGSVTFANCVARGFATAGISLRPSGTTRFLIEDTIVSDNGVYGFLVSPQGSGSARGAFEKISANQNGFGVELANSGAQINVAIANSMIENNSGPGVAIAAGKTLQLYHSVIRGNFFGVRNSGLVETAGNNLIRGNVEEISGALTDVGSQ